MDLDRPSETNQAGGRIEPLSCLANRFPKKIKSPVACSQREVAIPKHRPHPWCHHAREANWRDPVESSRAPNHAATPPKRVPDGGDSLMNWKKPISPKTGR